MYDGPLIPVSGSQQSWPTTSCSTRAQRCPSWGWAPGGPLQAKWWRLWRWRLTLGTITLTVPMCTRMRTRWGWPSRQSSRRRSWSVRTFSSSASCGACFTTRTCERCLPEAEAGLSGPLPHPLAHGLQAWEGLFHWMRTAMWFPVRKISWIPGQPWKSWWTKGWWKLLESPTLTISKWRRS